MLSLILAATDDIEAGARTWTCGEADTLSLFVVLEVDFMTSLNSVDVPSATDLELTDSCAYSIFHAFGELYGSKQ